MVGGLLLLIGGCVSTCAYIAAKKTRAYAAEAAGNPLYAAAIARSGARVSTGKAAAMAETLMKMPSYLPPYPGAKTVEGSFNTVMGMNVGNYVALSSDKPSAVSDFYEKKLVAAGYTILVKNADSNDQGPTASLSATVPQHEIRQ